MFEASSHMPSTVVSRRDLSLGFASLPPIDVQKIWSVLWRGKITILLSMMIAVGLAAAFVLLVPHKYTATTQILIDPMDLRGAQSDISPTIPQSDAAVLQVESQARVIASDNVLRRVVASEGLDHDPEFMHGAMAEKYGPLAALNELQKHVQVKRSERTYVVDVSVTSEDPDKAARIANAIAQTYLTEQTEVRSNAARQISQALTGRLKELQTRVRDAEQKVEAYKASHNIVGATGELVNEQQLTSLNAQLSASRARTSEAKARLDQVESVLHSKTPIGAFPEAVQSQTISLLRSQYAEIMRRDAEQKSSLGERHPAVIEIEAQGARLQKLIEDEVNRIAASDRAEYERAKADEDMLSRQVDGLKNTAVSTNESLVGLRELERDVQASRAVYESFLVRSRETGEQEQVDTKNIRIISKADRPLYRSSPPPSLFSAWRRCCSASLRASASSSCGERPKTPRRGRPRRERRRRPISAGWARLPRNYGRRPSRHPPFLCWRHCPTSISRSAWMRSKTRIRVSPAKSRKCTRLCAQATKSAVIRAFSSSPPTMKTTPLRWR